MAKIRISNLPPSEKSDLNPDTIRAIRIRMAEHHSNGVGYLRACKLVAVEFKITRDEVHKAAA